MSSIEELKSTISAHGGLAKSNRFSINLPDIGSSAIAPSDLNVLCTSVNLPGKQITTVEKAIGGLQSKVAYGQQFVETSMTFLVPVDYSIRQYFADWQRLAFDPETLEPGYRNDYVRTVSVSQLSSRQSAILDFNKNLDGYRFDEFPPYRLKLLRAYPIQIGEIQLSNEANGLVTLNVNFSFDRYTEEYLK